MNKKIVLIDDDVDFVEINKNLLEKEGFQVSFAYNGREGLQKIQENQPDLVILDVMMDSADEGFQVAKEMRASEAFRQTPILMLSSINKTEDTNWQYGPDDRWNPVDVFVDKPVKADILLQKIRKMLNN